MCDSSFEIEEERAASEEKDVVYEKVPEDLSYKFKFKDSFGKTYKFFPYLLKEGRDLPCDYILKGDLLEELGDIFYH